MSESRGKFGVDLCLVRFVWIAEQPRKNPDLVKGQNRELKETCSRERLRQEAKNGTDAEFYTTKQKHKRLLFTIAGGTRPPRNWEKETSASPR